MNRKPSRIVAEARGLARRDAVVSEHPGAAGRSETPEGKTESGIDQNFKLWSAIIRLSPFSLALRQQALMARMVLGFMLPGKSTR